jgi:alanyl-tRNA synthetase
MKYLELINLFRDYFDSQGVEELEPCGLISPAFPNTFNPSAAHDIVREVVNTQHVIQLVKRQWVIEKCIRQVDIPRLGDGTHLCLFEMIASVIQSPAHSVPREEVIHQCLQLISNCLQLPKDRLVITCFGGANISGMTFEPDSATPNIWRKFGIKTILFVPGRNNFIYLESEGEAAGPRCEIYYQLERPVGITRYVEIGSVIFETHRFHRGRLVETTNVASGFAFGLERLLMVIDGCYSIYDCDVLKPLVQLVINSLTDKKYADVFNDRILVATDVLKALHFVLAEILAKRPVSLSNQQKDLLLRLLRVAKEACTALQLSFDTILQPFADMLARIYAHRYPEIEANFPTISKILHSLLTSPNRKSLESVLVSCSRNGVGIG